MEDLLNFKQAQIEALQKKLQEMQTELDTAKELLKGIVKEYEIKNRNSFTGCGFLLSKRICLIAVLQMIE